MHSVAGGKAKRVGVKNGTGGDGRAAAAYQYSAPGTELIIHSASSHGLVSGFI